MSAGVGKTYAAWVRPLGALGAWRRAVSRTGSVTMSAEQLAILERHARRHDLNLRVRQLTNTGDRIVALFDSYLGLHETPAGSNSGPMIDRWLARCGLHPGYAWCAAAASCIALDAGGTLPGGVPSASCYDLHVQAQRAGVWIPAAEAMLKVKPGYIGIFQRDEHAVCVTGFAQGGVADIAGNTSASDGHNFNGGEVAAHVHPLSDFAGFIPTW